MQLRHILCSQGFSGNAHGSVMKDMQIGHSFCRFGDAGLSGVGGSGDLPSGIASTY